MPQAAFISFIVIMSKRKYNMPVWDFYEKNDSNKLVTCKHCPNPIACVEDCYLQQSPVVPPGDKTFTPSHTSWKSCEEEKAITYQPTLHKFTASKQKSQQLSTPVLQKRKQHMTNFWISSRSQTNPILNLIHGLRRWICFVSGGKKTAAL